MIGEDCGVHKFGSDVMTLEYLGHCENSQKGLGQSTSPGKIALHA